MDRFIPAHAGNTPSPYNFCSCLQVHPRSRGEYFPFCLPFDAIAGSSPLTRGIRGKIQQTQRSTRFIPAHAGNTPRSFIFSLLYQVHPRSRGEYYPRCPFLHRSPGSSPLTRGILIRPVVFASWRGFIPAHAGNTDPKVIVELFREVHPRSRGEYAEHWKAKGYKSGSSPLTRGIH